MRNKLEDPTVQVVYSIEQEHLFIEGLDTQHVGLFELSREYPRDAYHSAIAKAADEHILDRRAGHVIELRRLQDVARGANILDKLQSTTDMSSAFERSAERIAEINNGPNMQAERKDVVSQSQAELSVISGAISHARRVLHRPTASPSGFVFQFKAGVYPAPGESTKQTIKEFTRVTDVLVEVLGKPVSEHDLIKRLYPGLYESNRPEAFRRFDEALNGVNKGDIAEQFEKREMHFLQKGVLYRTHKLEARAENQVGVYYRSVWCGDELIVNNKNGIKQRVNVNGELHVLAWEGVTPEIRGQK